MRFLYDAIYKNCETWFVDPNKGRDSIRLHFEVGILVFTYNFMNDPFLELKAWWVR